LLLKSNNFKKITAPSSLAINGALPLFPQPRVVGFPRVGDREKFFSMCNDIFDRNWLTNGGVYVKAFAKRLAEFLGVRHVIPVCNATVGLEIAAKVLGLSGEVLVPSFTFIATVHILQWLGIKPVFVDVNPVTHCLAPAAVEKAITEKTTGILAVHTWGNICDIEALENAAHRHNLQLFFDAAHAFGCSHKGVMAGNFGKCEVCSFHATKIFNTFEGGAITTNDDELAEKLRKAKNFGFAGHDTITALGTNGKMNEVSAAMGLVNLDAFPRYVEEAKRNHGHYREIFSAIPGIEIMPFSDNQKHNYHYIVALLDGKEFGMSRDRIHEILQHENVLSQRYFYPGCHNFDPYKRLYPEAGYSLPVTNDLCRKTLVLPNHGMSEEDIEVLGEFIAGLPGIC
jgi:dTDP-4-amino-4,6-dideoxygalactose transaminase